MKKTVVLFKRVRDCPHWCDGQCTHVDNWEEDCNKNEIGLPPDTCPCEDVVVDDM